MRFQRVAVVQMGIRRVQGSLMIGQWLGWKKGLPSKVFWTETVMSAHDLACQTYPR
jgi:hypothetical protein